MKPAFRKILSVLLASVMLAGPLSAALADTLALPSQLKVIEESAFESDRSLDRVQLPEGVEEIGERAFADSSLTGINLPDSLTWIADSAFDGTQGVSFSANPVSYAFNWLRVHRCILSFDDYGAYNISVEMAIVEDDESIDMHTDSFVGWFGLADVEWWAGRLSGAPQWSITRVSGPEMPAQLTPMGAYGAELTVGMPYAPGTSTYDVRCAWGDQETTARVTVTYVYPDALPQGTDIPDCLVLTPEVDNVIPLSFLPASFHFSENRVGLENYTGEADNWFEGNELHIVPHNEGTFTGYVTLYAGNIYIGKTVVFRVGGGGDALDLRAEASGLDWYTLSWTPLDGAAGYTVTAYLDEACTQPFLSEETAESYAVLGTDVGVRYWFVVECDADGRHVRSRAVTVDPVAPLPAPQNLTAEIGEDGAVYLAWDAVEGAQGYRVYYTYGAPEWSLETDWYSFFGDPCSDALMIDRGETLTVWVCADNGDGPNERAEITVSREAGITDEELLDMVNEGYDLSLSTDVLDGLTADGIEDPEEAAAFMAQVEEARSALAAYHAALDELADYVDEAYDGMNVTMDGGAIVYTSSNNTFAVSADALSLLTSDYTVGEWSADDDSGAQLEITVNGETCYLKQTASGLAVVSPNGFDMQGASLGDPIDDNMMADLNGMKETGAQLRDLFGALQESANLLNLALSGLQEYGHFPDLDEMCETVGVVQNILEILGMPEKFANIGEAHRMLIELNDIAGHGHPTAMESMSSYSSGIVQIMLSKLNAARWALVSEVLNNFYGLVTGAKSIAIDLLKGKVTGINAPTTLDKMRSYFASKALSSRKMKEAYKKAHQLYEEVRNYDRELHYDVQGVVRDDSSNRTVPGVEVGILFTYDDPGVRTTTDANGYYSIEVPWSPAVLTFDKDGYYSQFQEVSVAPYVPARRDIRLGRDAWGTLSGTVTDEYGDILYGATIYTGEYYDGSWEYSAVVYYGGAGTYQLALPAGTHEITVHKDGYRNATYTVTIPADENYPLDPVLPWMYGIKGTVMSDVGPVPNADIHFFKNNDTACNANTMVASCKTNENGEFHYRLPPGVYKIKASSLGSYISADLVHDNYEQSDITVPEEQVVTVNPQLICIQGRFRKGIVGIVSGDKDTWIEYISATYSWGPYTATNYADPAHYGVGCTCVSDVKDVTVHATVTYKVDGVTYVKSRTALIDLTATEGVEGVYSTSLGRVTIIMGRYDEP